MLCSPCDVEPIFHAGSQWHLVCLGFGAVSLIDLGRWSWRDGVRIRQA